MKAHVAANCAADQGKYWQMHDKIFRSQPAIKPDQLRKYAQDVGLDMDAFDKCFNGTTKLAEIRNDMTQGTKMGVRGTPSFGLGYTDPKSSKVKIIRVIRGAQPYAAFKRAIDEMLSSPGKQAP
jgi:protein-disulfide isomerase